jgi:hypothetical protein
MSAAHTETPSAEVGQAASGVEKVLQYADDAKEDAEPALSVISMHERFVIEDEDLVADAELVISISGDMSQWGAWLAKCREYTVGEPEECGSWYRGNATKIMVLRDVPAYEHVLAVTREPAFKSFSTYRVAELYKPERRTLQFALRGDRLSDGTAHPFGSLMTAVTKVTKREGHHTPLVRIGPNRYSLALLDHDEIEEIATRADACGFSSFHNGRAVRTAASLKAYAERNRTAFGVAGKFNKGAATREVCAILSRVGVDASGVRTRNVWGLHAETAMRGRANYIHCYTIEGLTADDEATLCGSVVEFRGAGCRFGKLGHAVDGVVRGELAAMTGGAADTEGQAHAEDEGDSGAVDAVDKTAGSARRQSGPPPTPAKQTPVARIPPTPTTEGKKRNQASASPTPPSPAPAARAAKKIRN